MTMIFFFIIFHWEESGKLITLFCSGFHPVRECCFLHAHRHLGT